ncbi:Deoxyribodipyrimidine photo-lyase [Planctomycetales bacterium 10988]|nr:Deoxyribodipyrimidine photo-lyase [Planctomycetales bacterium 10988]
MRNLVLVLGDQLDHSSPVFEAFDKKKDAIWMAEVAEEATHVWCHKTRLVLFFSAMRHFKEELEKKKFPVEYHALKTDKRKDRGKTFAEVLKRSVKEHQPEKLIVLEPGDYRVQEALQQQAESLGIELEIKADPHFYYSKEAFQQWASGRKLLVLETFYRQLRKEFDILMKGKKPLGGSWNFDKENRENFSKDGPGKIKAPRSFRTDATTDEVMKLVNQRFASHPGSVESFDLPVTRKQSLKLLKDFIQHRLPRFGDYQDASWTERPFLYHSRLSAPLNLHLLNPREVVQAAEDAYHQKEAPLNCVEGFIRQILGWREFVRGIYWLKMPRYETLNSLDCEDLDVPSFYWDGETDMQCIHQSISQVKEFAYAHHIQRLMILGLFAQLLGVHPYQFHLWHMAMYADAIDWVSLPNTLGMSQHGDGGIVGTKPYCASGNYISRMSNYCKNCRYQPKKAYGENACPVTTLYWDFLSRHRKAFENNRRMMFQMKNLEKKEEKELQQIYQQAERVKQSIRFQPPT